MLARSPLVHASVAVTVCKAHDREFVRNRILSTLADSPAKSINGLCHKYVERCAGSSQVSSPWDNQDCHQLHELTWDVFERSIRIMLHAA
jgi:hypothetical protein